MSWQQATPYTRIEDLADKGKWSLNGGPFGSKLVSSMYADEGVPVIRGANMGDGSRFHDADFVFVTAEKANELRAHTARRGDVVFTQRGTLGQVALIPLNSKFDRYVISQSQMKLTVDPLKADAAFIYYCFCDPKVRSDFVGLASSSGVPHVNLATLREYSAPVPPLPTQRRIANILSTYDDLIENNTRRLAILEDMARRLFEEWFGQGDDVGDAGPVRIDALIDFDPRTKVPKEGRKPFLPMPCVPTNSMVVSKWEEREGNSGSKFLNGDTLLARITPCLENGKTAFVDFLPDGTAGFGSTEFIVMRGRSVPPEFVYCLARSNAFREHAIKSMSGATGRQRVSSAAVAQFEIATPRPEQLNQFGTAARPMFAMVRSLADANTNLRTTRDLLLPKLISGEIDVRAAEDASEAVAA